MVKRIEYTKRLDTDNSNSLRWVLLNENTGTLIVEWQVAHANDKVTAYEYDNLDLEAFERGFKSARSKGSYVSRFTAGHRSARSTHDPFYRLVSVSPVAAAAVASWKAVLSTKFGELNVDIDVPTDSSPIEAVNKVVAGTLVTGSYQVVRLERK
jgi:hypothetical protein